MSDTKQCKACGEHKPTGDFHPSTAAADGLQSYCKHCSALKLREYRTRHPERTRERNRAYYAQNGEAVREQARRWHAEHPGTVVMRNRALKARLAGAEGEGLTVAEWDAILERYGHQCLACGSKNVTVDHVVPLSRGGRHEASNVQPLCASCNASKGTKTVDYRPALATGTDG